MRPIETRFFEFAFFPEESTFPVEHGSEFFQHFDVLSSIATACFYVVDIQHQQFCYIQPDDLFLCGYSVEDALKLGYNFYPKIVYPDDLPLWAKMHKAVIKYIRDYKEDWEEIDYFSCTFRIQRRYSFLIHPLPQMICHRMRPVWEDDELRYFVCSVESSTAKEAGNLRMYSKHGLTYEEYRIKSTGWDLKTIELLTERERAILMLAQQGKNSGEIADLLCKGHYTVRNQIKPIFSKLDVNSMIEAIDTASHYHMIYVPKQQDVTEPEQPPVKAPHKRPRILITDSMFQSIQKHLNEGLSMRKAAKKAGVLESAVRYWKKKGKIKITKKSK